MMGRGNFCCEEECRSLMLFNDPPLSLSLMLTAEILCCARLKTGEKNYDKLWSGGLIIFSFTCLFVGMFTYHHHNFYFQASCRDVSSWCSHILCALELNTSPWASSVNAICAAAAFRLDITILLIYHRIHKFTLREQDLFANLCFSLLSLSLGTSCVVTFPLLLFIIFMKQLHHSASSRKAWDSLTLCYNFMYAKQLMMLYLGGFIVDGSGMWIFRGMKEMQNPTLKN